MGAKDISFDDASSPSELLEKLTSGQGGGRTLMARGLTENETKSDSESDEAEVEKSPTPPSSPKLFVAAPSRKLLANGQPPLAPGVYFGSWNAPDHLTDQFASGQRVVTVDSLLQATEACEQLEAPLLFL